MERLDAVEISDICFSQFSVLVHEMTGITIRPDRRTMLTGRLRRRIRELNLHSYESYFEFVTNNRVEHEHFINAITTNETYFYRTPRIWKYISDEFLPAWKQENTNRALKVWSAASSTGEEAYTLGILLQQYKDQNADFDYHILGTDIAPNVIERANNGVYQGRAIEQFRHGQAELFARYMTGDDDQGYSVIPTIKSRVRFAQCNLFSIGKQEVSYDLILLRNVLIYFTKNDQEKAMANINRSLTPCGTAIIGESETLNNLNTDFEPIAPTIYRSRDTRNMSRAA